MAAGQHPGGVGAYRLAAAAFFPRRRRPPRFQTTAAISFSKLTRFSTRFKLYTRVIRLHSHRTFAKLLDLQDFCMTTRPCAAANPAIASTLQYARPAWAESLKLVRWPTRA